MRIAHVSDVYLPSLGGIEVMVHDLATRQAEAGHDVQVITSTPGGGSGFALDDDTRGLPEVDVVRVRGPVRLPWSFADLGAGRRAMRLGDFDVVHVHISVVSPLSFAVAQAAVAAGIPTVVTQHSLWVGVVPSFIGLDFATGWTRWPVTWTAVSEVAAEPLRRALRGRAQVLILPNAIDVDAWRVTPSERDDDDVVVASVLRLAPRKRPLQLLEILRTARERTSEGVRLRAVLVGEGPQRASMERYIKRHDMTGWVHLPGRFTHDEIRALYRRADIYVAPADLESFGIAALEARSAGLAVVAKRDSGVAEFVTHGREGLLCPSDGAMASAVAALADSPALRRAIRDHNRATAPSVTWARAVASTMSTYELAAWTAGRSSTPVGGGAAQSLPASMAARSSSSDPTAPALPISAIGSEPPGSSSPISSS